MNKDICKLCHGSGEVLAYQGSCLSHTVCPECQGYGLEPFRQQRIEADSKAKDGMKKALEAIEKHFKERKVK